MLLTNRLAHEQCSLLLDSAKCPPLCTVADLVSEAIAEARGNGWPARGELTFNDFLIIKTPLKIPRNQFYLF